MKNIKIIFFTILLTLPIVGFSQTSHQDSLLMRKVDSILALNKIMYKEAKNNPLEKYKYGIEINPFRLLTMAYYQSFSATFSMFDVNRKAELAFPFLYSGKIENKGIEEISVDAHYRYFLGNTQNGFYISGMFRFSRLTGEPGSNYNNYYSPYYTNSRPDQTIVKPGIGGGFGVRVFSYSGFYWGTSLSFGKYISNNNNYFNHSYSGNIFTADSEFFIDWEILKFGWAF